MLKKSHKLFMIGATIAVCASTGIIAPLKSAEFNLRMHSFIPPVANPAKPG